MRRLDNIDLRLLRVFLTLTETGSFAAAQIALNLSQPTLSGHIAALERSLGGSLCLRGRRGFKLTPFGEATARAARQLFAEIDGFQQRIAEYNGQLVGRLRIGVVDGVVTCPDLGLQAVLDRVIGRAHSLFIDLELGTPHELERGINEGRYDVAVGPLSQKAPGITYVSLHREAQALYCGRGHPLFAVPDSAIDQAAIERSAFSVRGYRQLEDLYRVNHPRASATVLHMEAQALLILSGRFIGFLPRHIGESWVSQGQMRVIKPQTYGFQSHHLVAYRRAAADQPLVQAFLQELRRRSSAPRSGGERLS